MMIALLFSRKHILIFLLAIITDLIVKPSISSLLLFYVTLQLTIKNVIVSSRLYGVYVYSKPGKKEKSNQLWTVRYYL